MADILYVRDKTGKFIPIPALVGPKGDPGDIKDLTINGKKPEAGALTLTAEDVGARADDWMPTAEDVGALGKNAQAKDSAKLGGKAPEYYVQPRNLLDNSDFTNPVSQRSAGNVTAQYGYPIDRWEFDKSSASLDASAGFNTTYRYLYLKNGDATAGTWSALYHKVPGEALEAGSYTLVLALHKTLSADISALALMDGDTTIKPSATYTPDKDGLIIIPFTLSKKPTTSLLLAVYALPGTTVGFDWAALYEGTYTADSLPPYTPKGYAAELAECRRYFYTTMDTAEYNFQGQGVVREAGKGEIAVCFPVEMRAVPTMQANGYFMTLPGFVGVTKDKITVDVMGKKRATLYVADSSFTTVGNAFLLTGNVASKGKYARLDFSADL